MLHHLLIDALVLILASLAIVGLFTRLRVSPIVGYLIAGIVVGPHVLNLVEASEGSRFLGELGIAALMFVIGFDFSWPRIVAAKRLVFVVGLLQVVLTTLVVAAAALIVGVPLPGALLLGFALAHSSTGIIHKQLLDQDEVAAPHGISTTGILLFQDLAALPVLLLIGELASGGEVEAGPALLRTAGVVVIFLAVALFARRTVGRLFDWIARTESNEPIMLAAFALIVGVAVLAESVDLSLAIAAFMVGLVLSESDYRHHLADELRPFRDLFLGLFFLTIGMSVDWTVVVTEPAVTIGALLLLLVVKLIIVFMIVRFGGADRGIALRTAVILAHGGELSLLILTQAIDGGLLPTNVAEAALAGTAASILLAPMLIQFNQRIALGALSSSAFHPDEPAIDRSSGGIQPGLRGHVILGGCGPVGRLICTVLEANRVPYLAIERDVERLRLAQREGHRVMFGDATRRGVLEAAGIEEAGAVVALLNSPPRIEHLVRQARHLNPSIPILVSTRDDRGLTPIVKAGATHIFPENHAAGLALAVQTFVVLGVPPGDALARVRAARVQLNPELRALPE